MTTDDNQPNTRATVDHLYQIGEPGRASKKLRNKCVLACRECNNTRSRYPMKMRKDAIDPIHPIDVIMVSHGY